MSVERTLFFALIIAAAILVAAVVVFWPGDGQDDPTLAGGPGRQVEAAGRESPAAGEQAAPLPDPLGDEESGEADTVALDPAGIFISGRVVNQETKEPVRKFGFDLQWLDDGKWIDVVDETVDDDEGRFFFLLEFGGKHRLSIKAPRYITIAREEIDVPLDAGLADLVLELDPGLGVTGRVVDDATGAPVEGALVGPVTYAAATDLVPLLFGAETEWNHVETDAEGRFDLCGLTGDNKTMAAVHPAYAESTATIDFNRATDVEIRLKTGARIFGKAFDDLGRPAAGLVVRMKGGTTPLARAVLTIQDGSFTLPTAVPGPLDVFAEPPPDVDEETFGFTKEKKTVDLRDRDVEIFFGLSPDHVTWRGRLFDYEGKPVPGARLTITPVRQSPSAGIYTRNDGTRDVRCGDGGDFEVRKLAPREYAVSLRLADGPSRIDWGTVAFEEPGVVVRDVRVTGGVIKGTVVDSATGRPLAGKGGFVSTMLVSHAYRWFSADIDDAGQFVLQGLPAARYRLDARVKGYPPAKSDEIELAENGRVENVAIPVFAGGTWVIRFTGFLKTDPRVCTIKWSRDGSREWGSSLRIDESGEGEASFELETGKWILTAEIMGWGGTVEREFEILPGETTETVIGRDEVALDEGLVNAAVRLAWSDGEPVAGAWVKFFSRDMQSGGPGKRFIHGTTDASGRVDLTGFCPGEWRIQIEMSDAGHAELPEIEIPAGAADPHPIDLVLPRGEVTGAFHDGMTGKPFGSGAPVWWVFLFDVRLGKNVTSIQGGKGSRFRILGIAGGEYALTFKARGYAERKTDVFRLAEGESLDLGRVDMEPLGILDLMVVDAAGNPVENYKLKGVEYQWMQGSESLSSGFRRLYGFPIGDAVVLIEAAGFRDKEINLRFEPGRPVEARVVLER